MYLPPIFYCVRSQVCDGKVNCPFEDDEFDCKEGECGL